MADALRPWRLAVCLVSGMAAQAALAQAALAQPAPVPPPRPFDLRMPSGAAGPLERARQPAPSATQEAAGAGAADQPGKAVIAPLPPERTPGSAVATAQPQARTDVAALPPKVDLVPRPEAEDEEHEWPRRTPGQRNLPFDPRVEPPDSNGVNGLSTDPGTSISCLPQVLKTMLDQVVAKYGAVRVTSTYRPVWRARRGSYHRRCEAVDFRVPGQSPRTVLAFVKTLNETGGHKVYWNGLIHVDTGPYRSW